MDSDGRTREKREYEWESGLLRTEKITDINLLQNENCCKDEEPVEVTLEFETGKTERGEHDPLIFVVKESEKLYTKGSQDELRYDLIRTIEYEQVKKAPELVDVFVDMAQSILFMVPTYTPIPPFELF